jgi:hypothetical protein
MGLDVDLHASRYRGGPESGAQGCRRSVAGAEPGRQLGNGAQRDKTEGLDLADVSVVDQRCQCRSDGGLAGGIAQFVDRVPIGRAGSSGATPA